jgi:hypothetical protein
MARKGKIESIIHSYYAKQSQFESASNLHKLFNNRIIWQNNGFFPEKKQSQFGNIPNWRKLFNNNKIRQIRLRLLLRRDKKKKPMETTEDRIKKSEDRGEN